MEPSLNWLRQDLSRYFSGRRPVRANFVVWPGVHSSRSENLGRFYRMRMGYGFAGLSGANSGHFYGRSGSLLPTGYACGPDPAASAIVLT
ncbi:MAG: hypothetical protein DWH78_14770 [Planctomycetota bacterium]|nr:MAG: hypothetical protein DWH78_14770 [Planctomycetota bacterium]